MIPPSSSYFERLMVYYLPERYSSGSTSSSTSSLHTTLLKARLDFNFSPLHLFFLLINRSKYDIGHNQHQNVYSRCKSALNSLESSGNQQNALDWDTETLAGRYRRKEYEVATVVLQRGIYSNCKQPGTILYTYRQAKYLADGI